MAEVKNVLETKFYKVISLLADLGYTYLTEEKGVETFYMPANELDADYLLTVCQRADLNYSQPIQFTTLLGTLGFKDQDRWDTTKKFKVWERSKK